MKTDDLADLLAAQVLPVAPRASQRRIALAVLAGLLLGAVWMVLQLGVRADLAEVLGQPGFWLKLALPLTVAGAAALLVQRLARPGVAPGRAWWAVATPVLLLWLLALAVLWQAAPAERWPLVLGQTWRACALNILLLSLPTFAGVLLALRSLAPTRPLMAGAAAGLLAGGIGALVYALHCPELQAPFLAVWYVAGMALPALLGLVLAPRLLRW